MAASNPPTEKKSFTREPLPRTGPSFYALLQAHNERHQVAFNQKSFVLPANADERLLTLISVCDFPLLNDVQLQALRAKAEADFSREDDGTRVQYKPLLVDFYEFVTERYRWLDHEPVVSGSDWERVGPEGFFFAGAGVLSAVSFFRNFNPVMAGLGALFGGSLAVTFYSLGLLYADPNHFTLRYRDHSYWEKGPLHSRTIE